MITATIPQAAPTPPPCRREEFVDGTLVEKQRVELVPAEDGRIAWQLWHADAAGFALSCWIELSIYTPSSGWRTWLESDNMSRVDVPIDWLDAAPALDQAWRDRVMQHAESRGL
jgi:hypothetical protein